MTLKLPHLHRFTWEVKSVNTQLNESLEYITAQLEPIERETAEVERRLAELKSIKAKLEAAYQALSGRSIASGKNGRKAAKPCARKRDVMELCLSIVKENKGIDKAALEEKVKEELGKNRGLSLSGLTLRMAECLRSDRFTVSEEGSVSLRNADPQMRPAKSA